MFVLSSYGLPIRVCMTSSFWASCLCLYSVYTYVHACVDTILHDSLLTTNSQQIAPSLSRRRCSYCISYMCCIGRRLSACLSVCVFVYDFPIFIYILLVDNLLHCHPPFDHSPTKLPLTLSPTCSARVLAYDIVSYIYVICCNFHQVLDRCLELEAEVDQIPQLKRRVDSYRRSHTDMEVANREQVRVRKYSPT